MEESRGGLPNLGVPRRSVGLRGVPRRPLVCSAASYFAALPSWFSGQGALGAKNISEFGKANQNMLDSKAVRPHLGVYRCPAVSLCLFGSVVFPRLPQLGTGRGSRAPKNIREFRRGAQKYGRFHFGMAKSRRSVALRRLPWCCAAPRCSCGSLVFRRLPQSALEKGLLMPNLLEN